VKRDNNCWVFKSDWLYQSKWLQQHREERCDRKVSMRIYRKTMSMKSCGLIRRKNMYTPDYGLQRTQVVLLFSIALQEIFTLIVSVLFNPLAMFVIHVFQSFGFMTMICRLTASWTWSITSGLSVRIEYGSTVRVSSHYYF